MAFFNTLTDSEINRIITFQEDRPLEVLGPKYDADQKLMTITAFLPRASKVWVLPNGQSKTPKQEMKQVHEHGLFQARFSQQPALFAYTLLVEEMTGQRLEFQDPYAFGHIITDFDLYLIGQGKHFQSYEKFGAHVGVFQGVAGTHFAVWAPNAKAVALVGDFNHWRAGAHPMERIGVSGVFGLFLPGASEGALYKYAIQPQGSAEVLIKADPYAFQAELRPKTASVICDLNRYQWQDQAWLAERGRSPQGPERMSIYEVHLGSWKRDGEQDWGFLNYRELAVQLVDYVKTHGYTHIELLPIMEHPLDISWGYQVINYFAPTSRFGTPAEFMFFIDYCHQHGIGVILDWVPAHFPKDQHGLNNFDGTQIYAYQDPKKGEHQDWGTLVFDYGRLEVKNFLISNALFWVDKYHLDGLRVDAVASMLYLDYSRRAGEWVPNQYGGRENLEAVAFLQEMNHAVHERFSGVITFAEESTSWPGVTRHPALGGLGFDYKWNMGWMHDSLDYFTKDPVFRRYHQGQLTFSLVYAFSERFILPISHDEVVHGKRSLLEKMPGDAWQKFANLRLFFGYMMTHPGKKMLFMGCDFGQRREWNAEASLDWHLLHEPHHRQLNTYISALHRFYHRYRACYELDADPRGFDWLDFSDSDNSILSYSRWSRDFSQLLVVVLNMTPVPRNYYHVGVPHYGYYQEVFNSDAADFGGTGMGNFGGVQAQRVACHQRPYSLNLSLPPLSVTCFCWEDQ